MKMRRVLAILMALALGLSLTSMVLALVGDLTIDGAVDDADMAIVASAYGSRASPPSPNWDWRADLNGDGSVNLADLTIAGRNYGDTFNFHWPRRISNGRTANPASTNVGWIDAVADSRGHVHVVWQESNGPLYYTQLDVAGNTVVEDIRLAGNSPALRVPRVAVDAQNNVHLVWLYYGSPNTGSWYVQLDAQGRTVISPTRFSADSCCDLAIATDGYGHPHILRSSGGSLWYTILDGRGHPLIADVRMNTVITGPVESAAIAVDRQGNRHVLWFAYTSSTGGDLVYTRLISGGLPSPNQITVTHITNWGSQNPVIQTDSQGAAHVLWQEHFGSGNYPVYWRRINPDGTMTPERLVTTESGPSAELDYAPHFVIDSSDRIHLVMQDKENHTCYARLDRDGNTLIPFRKVVYASNDHPVITVGPGGQTALLYPSSGHSTDPLFVMSAVPDAAANDTTRADLVLDAAHIWASPRIARIIDSATVTVTVANGGWVTATNVVVSFTETISRTAIPPATIAALPPFSRTTVVRTFSIPDLEDNALLPIRVSASTATPETTLTNNAVTTTLAILPPARTVDLAVAVFDETYAPTDRSMAAYLIGGQLRLATLPPVSHSALITSTNAYNYFIGVPLNTADPPAMTTTMVITLTAPGFSTATQVVTATRDIANPYRVFVTPAEIKLYVNQWGDIQGTVLSGTLPLSMATVTLDTGATTTTNAGGTFTFTKVVSGTHTVEAIHAGNLPTTVPVSVRTGQVAAPSITMPPTTKGWVRGTVWNDWGHPFAGATVQLWAGSTQLASTTTGDDGRYVLEVANAGAYSSYQVRASAAGCKPYTSGTFALTAGIPRQHDFTLEWEVTSARLQQSGEVVSWHQEESWNRPDYDGSPIAWLWEQAVQEIQEELGLYSYSVDVWWGKYRYALGLNYSEAGGVKTVEGLGVRLNNGPLYSYNVQGGGYEAGMSDIDRTNLRVDRVDLVTVDGAGNVTGGPYWASTAQWYANQPDGSATVRSYTIDATPANWSNAAIRIFLRVGKYDPSRPETSYWAPWMPPAPVASLNGSGAVSGADYQCILWRLGSNSVEVIQSAPYYASAVSVGGLGLEGEPTAVEAAGVAPQASVAVSLTFPVAPPAYVGTPFAVDVSVSGATAKPVYGVEFDLRFNPAHLRVQSVQAAPDFLGPDGAWVVLTPTLSDINASGRLTDTAVVRLGALAGLVEGRLARITFVPRMSGINTTLDLSGVRLADEHGHVYSPNSTRDASLRIADARVYLPLMLRAGP
jgi:hypothetical protein